VKNIIDFKTRPVTRFLNLFLFHVINGLLLTLKSDSIMAYKTRIFKCEFYYWLKNTIKRDSWSIWKNCVFNCIGKTRHVTRDLQDLENASHVLHPNGSLILVALLSSNSCRSPTPSAIPTSLKSSFDFKCETWSSSNSWKVMSPDFRINPVFLLN